MGDILTQEEINQLIAALNTGEIDVTQIQAATQEKKVRNYNFRTPNKFAKDHLKTLQFIYENYSRLLTSFLTGYLRTLVQVDFTTVETMPYSDFSNAIPNPVILALADFIPLFGTIILEIDPKITYALIDRILGGKGSSIDKIREFSEIERAVIERIITQMLNLMRDPWENVTPVRPRLEKIETNAQFAQIISPNEMVALITLRSRVGEVEGMINICIPHMVVEPIMSKMSTRLWFTKIEKETTDEIKNSIESKIECTKVPIRAVLGKAIISVNDFVDLQMGDVIPLDSGINDHLDILVGDLLKFYGKPGVKKNRVSIKITEVLRKEDE